MRAIRSAESCKNENQYPVGRTLSSKRFGLSFGRKILEGPRVVGVSVLIEDRDAGQIAGFEPVYGTANGIEHVGRLKIEVIRP
jgi:hypothetical protein